MKLKTVIALFSVLVFLGCNKIKAPEKPDNLISKEKMVAILIDSKIIGAASSVDKRIMKENGVDVNTYIYEKHNIDSLQFALSNNYYAFHVKDYKNIYEQVNDSLEALKAAFKVQEAEEWKNTTKKEEDSIKAIQATKDSIDFAAKTGKSKIEINKDSIFKTRQNKLDSIKPLLKKGLRAHPKNPKLINPVSSK
ncbi:hypothetical protein PK35_03560 [Tamlana nanhaiensis]|uniref:DUF4296 domain-containing protein n=1 Tax=Neotamlana nanhaiensis TaxID=1382798 RepID=A0A0D7W562_9FLAO|nr:DUF4296 domain-containing protein [Tamlana nanhaiensis]KJD33838.1 hypothetical protein PK35_03560 [Tamlana nanhaiensis]